MKRFMWGGRVRGWQKIRSVPKAIPRPRKTEFLEARIARLEQAQHELEKRIAALERQMDRDYWDEAEEL